MKKIFFIFPEFKGAITGGTFYDYKVSFYLKKIHVPIKNIIVSDSINRIKLSSLINNLPKKSTVLIDGYLVNKIPFLFNKNIHILIHHPCCFEAKEGKMSNLNLYFNEKRALNYSKSIITVSKYMKKVIRSILYQKIKTEVAYPGIDKIYYYNKRNLTSSNILAIGNVIERKGYSLLIESLASIKSTWHLNIIGKYSTKDPFFIKLTELIDKYKLSDNITFLGNIPNDAKMKHLKESKLFVLPTFYEGFGMSLVEASALGIHVITSDLPVLREVLKGGQVDFIPINDVKEFSKAITIGLSGNAEINNSGLKHYNWETTAKNMKRALYAY